MFFARSALIGLTFAAGLAMPGLAQQFTTAEEVRPMLDATKARWIAVREFDGQDLLYFTNLLAWRCGLDAIFFSVNGAAEKRWPEGCYENDTDPNAVRKTPYVTFPLGSVETVNVRITYDDGGSDSATYARGAIMTP